MRWCSVLLAPIFLGTTILSVVRAGQENIPDPAAPPVLAGQHQKQEQEKAEEERPKKRNQPAPESFHPSERIDADTEIAFPADI